LFLKVAELQSYKRPVVFYVISRLSSHSPRLNWLTLLCRSFCFAKSVLPAAAPADHLTAKLLQFAIGGVGTLKSFWLPLIEQKKLI